MKKYRFWDISVKWIAENDTTFNSHNWSDKDRRDIKRISFLPTVKFVAFLYDMEVEKVADMVIVAKMRIDQERELLENKNKT